jgi:hypothetical protein
MHRTRAVAAISLGLGLAFTACSAPADTPAPRLSPLANLIGITTIAQAITDEGAGIKCGPPGGGGGFGGTGANPGLLAHLNESTTCAYPDGSLDKLATAWSRLGTQYLQSQGVTTQDPAVSAGEGERVMAWTYTFGPSTGVYAISIVPVDSDTYRVLGDVTEIAPE